MTITCDEQPGLRLEDLAWLIDAEYKEMPGMRLTFAQARRLWNLSTDDCGCVLEYLVSRGRLTRDAGGRFYRAIDAC